MGRSGPKNSFNPYAGTPNSFSFISEKNNEKMKKKCVKVRKSLNLLQQIFSNGTIFIASLCSRFKQERRRFTMKVLRVQMMHAMTYDLC